MSVKTPEKTGKFRKRDLIVVLLFLFIAVIFITLFWLDLMQTINLQNIDPVGTVVIKRNTVQRRLSSRVLWDRLSYESPVYLWDLIRVADDSAATLYLEGNSIDLDENTLIRIVLSPDGEGLQIIMSEGSLSVFTSQEGRGILLEMNGNQVHVESGSAITTSANENGFSFQVISGSASFNDGTRTREISSGSIISIDNSGSERNESTAVVTSPFPNARFLKNSLEPVMINYSWNRVNLEPDQTLRLEIALDRNFTQIVNTIDNLVGQTDVPFDRGLWYWRLSSEEIVLSSGELTVADTVSEYKSPVVNSLFRYTFDLPEIFFHWDEVDNAISYILEINDIPDFTSPKIIKTSSSVFLTESNLTEGIWYWRVIPVFPSVYSNINTGSGSSVSDDNVSITSFFRVEQNNVINNVTEVPSLSEWFVMETLQQPLQAVQPPVESVPAAINIIPPSVPPSVPVSPPLPPVVQPPPRLPSPGNMQPEVNTVFGFSELQQNREIVFNWSEVQGANAYIFTLFQETPTGRRQIIQTAPIPETVYILNDYRLLDRGNFIWQVEPLIISGTVIERRGLTAENRFVLDFPPPATVVIEETGILYGN